MYFYCDNSSILTSNLALKSPQIVKISEQPYFLCVDRELQMYWDSKHGFFVD